MKRGPQIKKFIEYLSTGKRPDSFEECYAATDGVNGFYPQEAKAIWDIIREDGKVEFMAEIGRNRGGGLFTLCCAATELKFVRSVDIAAIPGIDEALAGWLQANKIGHNIEIANSRDAKPELQYDFVYIDGEHTGEGVKADLNNWREHTRLLGFHDFANRGSKNKHKRVFKDVVREISYAANLHGWPSIGLRGRSEIVYRVK